MTLLLQDLGLKPVVAIEIEFYLVGGHSRFAPAQMIEWIRECCAHEGLTVASVDQERGPGQYEISLLPNGDIEHIIADTERFRTMISKAFSAHGMGVDFSARPLPGQPGSGLHVHVHLEDMNGNNVFFREEEDFSPCLLHALGGLLAFMNPCMPYFAPVAASYPRFHGSHNAPQTVSWGTNNRTVALRLPPKPMVHKHIEHRVAGSDADVRQVVMAILAGLHYGLTHTLSPGKPIYGDARLAQYGLPKLAQTLEEALRHKAQCSALLSYAEHL